MNMLKGIFFFSLAKSKMRKLIPFSCDAAASFAFRLDKGENSGPDSV